MRWWRRAGDDFGDGLLVLFGAPMHQPDHADRAVATALAMDEAAQRFNAAVTARGIKCGHTRIGVHTGMALVGNIGTHGKLKYGALGDTLNTASRVEGLNKYIGSRVAVTGETAAQCRRQVSSGWRHNREGSEEPCLSWRRSARRTRRHC
jgi:class 3 adenylate cyclase